jgi:hypothetical protein
MSANKGVSILLYLYQHPINDQRQKHHGQVMCGRNVTGDVQKRFQLILNLSEEQFEFNDAVTLRAHRPRRLRTSNSQHYLQYLPPSEMEADDDDVERKNKISEKMGDRIFTTTHDDMIPRYSKNIKIGHDETPSISPNSVLGPGLFISRTDNLSNNTMESQKES